MENMIIEMRSNQTGIGAIAKVVKRDWMLYALLLPVVIWFIVFVYKPMGGLLIAFNRFEPIDGIFGSEMVGFAWFDRLVFGAYKVQFWQAFRNTFMISLYGLIFGFPIPIFLALLFSEVRNETYRKITQTITYLPHFLSEVTITGIVLTLLYTGEMSTGIIAQILINLNIVDPGVSVMAVPNYFRPVYLITGIWKESGYSSIVYFASIMGISPVLYEALKVDGGNKLQEIKYVTIPGMAPTLIIMIIMRIGRMLSVGYERVLLLYNTSVYSTADVLSTFEQRIGIINGDFSSGAAAGLFNSVIGFALVMSANTISRKVSKTSLW